MKGRRFSENDRRFIGEHQDALAGVYDSRVMVIDATEKEADGSAATVSKNATVNDPSASTINIADLYDLVNDKYQKYLPQRTTPAGEDPYSVGAAPAGFDPYARMGNGYGTIFRARKEGGRSRLPQFAWFLPVHPFCFPGGAAETSSAGQGPVSGRAGLWGHIPEGSKRLI